jgi:hypothetical protein
MPVTDVSSTGWRFRRLLARAIDAPVLRAHRAGLFQALTQLGSCAMKPHRGVVRSRAELLCRGRHSVSFEVNASENVRVFRLQRAKQFIHAAAHSARIFRGCILCELSRKSFQRFFSRASLAIDVDDAAPQDAIEPRHELVSILKLPGRFQRLEKAALHHIRGEFRVSQTVARKRTPNAPDSGAGLRPHCPLAATCSKFTSM